MPPTPPINARQRIRQPGTIIVGRQNLSHGKLTSEHNSNEKVEAAPDIPHPAYVTVKGGVTINMDNFESCRVDVAVSMPCAPDAEAIEACYQECSRFVDEKIALERDLAMGVTPAQEGVTA